MGFFDAFFAGVFSLYLTDGGWLYNIIKIINLPTYLGND